jgi:hypothetical protein
MLRVIFCAGDRAAEVAEALQAGELPPDDPDEPTVALSLFGLLHCQQHPLDLARLMVESDSIWP